MIQVACGRCEPQCVHHTVLYAKCSYRYRYHYRISFSRSFPERLRVLVPHFVLQFCHGISQIPSSPYMQEYHQQDHQHDTLSL